MRTQIYGVKYRSSAGGGDVNSLTPRRKRARDQHRRWADARHQRVATPKCRSLGQVWWPVVLAPRQKRTIVDGHLNLGVGEIAGRQVGQLHPNKPIATCSRHVMKLTRQVA